MALLLQYLLKNILNLELYQLSVVDTAHAYISFLFSLIKQEEQHMLLTYLYPNFSFRLYICGCDHEFKPGLRHLHRELSSS